MDAHWDEDISLTSLARITGLSPWHLVRVMTRATGLPPPHAHLLERRCRAARDMLDGQSRLADIAAATGFADQSHLTRTFRARFGLTPGTPTARLFKTALSSLARLQPTRKRGGIPCCDNGERPWPP